MASHTEMETGDSSEDIVGDLCKVLGLTRSSLLSSVENNDAFRSLKHSAESLSNGPVLEFFQLKETEKLTFKACTTWLEGISGRERSTLNSKAVSCEVNRVKDKCTYLLKANKEQWHLLSEQVLEPSPGEEAGSGSRAGSSSEAESKPTMSSCDQATEEMMAAELVSMEGELAAVNKRKYALEETVKRQRIRSGMPQGR